MKTTCGLPAHYASSTNQTGLGALDPQTDTTVRLFNPRLENWGDHFRWNETGDRIIGLTPSGRVTIIALNLNRPSLVLARKAWVQVGWHPPTDI